jgi:hypothetical protein
VLELRVFVAVETEGREAEVPARESLELGAAAGFLTAGGWVPLLLVVVAGALTLEGVLPATGRLVGASFGLGASFVGADFAGEGLLIA